MISRFRFPLRVQINSKFTRIYFPAEQVTIWADWRTMWASDTECKKGHWPRKTLIIWPSDYLTATRLIEGFWRRSKYSHEWVVPRFSNIPGRIWLVYVSWSHHVCKMTQISSATFRFLLEKAPLLHSLVGCVVHTGPPCIWHMLGAHIWEVGGSAWPTIPYHTIPYHSC